MSTQASCDCGCCGGVHPRTPSAIENRAGLSAIAYRSGTYARFRDSMLAALTSPPRPASCDDDDVSIALPAPTPLPTLTALTSRDDDDFSIALIDAWASVADVLTFYQERIANESYLRTATETLSLVELARLVGYELQPGVAASAWLAFTIDESEGAPAGAIVPRGSRVQSVPGQNEEPQTFETSSDLDARRGWNALRPRTTEAQKLTSASRFAYIASETADLQPGDALLVVSDKQQLVRVTKVDVDAELSRTRVEWSDVLPLTLKAALPPPAGLYAMRVRASLFAHNAPDRRALRTEEAGQIEADATTDDWKFTFTSPPLPVPPLPVPPLPTPPLPLPLDGVYPAIHAGSWVALTGPAAQLYYASSVTDSGLTLYTVSGKSTQLQIGPDLGAYAGAANYRSTSVFAASELLPLAESPIEGPLNVPLELEGRVDDLLPGRALILHGKAMHSHDSDVTEIPLNPGFLNPGFLATARMASPFQMRPVGTPTPAPTITTWTPSLADDPYVSELAFIDTVTPGDHTKVTLRSSLKTPFDPYTVTIFANVIDATHGESLRETLGSGDGTETFQRFALNQSPLTYVSAANPRGIESTLAVFVNDTRWREVDTLYGTAASDRVYITRRDSEAKTTVQFGNGVSGARLPSGSNNVRAEYRKGLGSAGLVRAEQLSLLLTQPFGVSDVINPMGAEGARDAESLEQVRRNAPRTVLTLDRVVSLLDYENFARSFGSVAKALATWTREGAQPVVFLTVAGENGASIDPDSALHRDLAAALRRFGNPNVPLRIASYRPASFVVTARVRVALDRVTAKVMAAVKDALQNAFSFDARSFAQPVDESEVFAVIQRVDGVVYVDIDHFKRKGTGESDAPRLVAAPAQQLPNGTLVAAELLTLDAWDQQDVQAAP